MVVQSEGSIGYGMVKETSTPWPLPAFPIAQPRWAALTAMNPKYFATHIKALVQPGGSPWLVLTKDQGRRMNDSPLRLSSLVIGRQPDTYFRRAVLTARAHLLALLLD